MRILEIVPTCGTFMPNQVVSLTAVISSDQTCPATLIVKYHHLADSPMEIEYPLHLIDGTQEVVIEWQAPGQPAGYAVHAELIPGDGSAASQAWTAFDILPHWTAFPRYGFLSDFSEGRPDPEETTSILAGFHINALQFYDWQYRHEQLLPPTETYTDPLGRSQSMRTVRSLIEAAHRHGMAAMPYLAVYAASVRFWKSHPLWALYDATGQPIPFGENFLGLMNPAPESPWVTHLLAEVNRMLSTLPFDGLHIDQYGDPKHVWDAHGKTVDLPRAFTNFISRARKEHPDKAVLFNAVGNWPIEALADAPLDFLYIEIWPPEVEYATLAEIVLNAVQLTGGKPVVVALYLSPDRPANILLADAVILACGGTRIELGEDARLLADPYFPKHQAIDDELRKHFRRFYDYAVRGGEWLQPYTLPESDRQEWSAAKHDQEFNEKGIMIWSVKRKMPWGSAVSLVNLSGVDNPCWDVPHASPLPLQNKALHLEHPIRPTQVFWSCPEQDGVPKALPFEYHKGEIHTVIPQISYTGLITIHD